jgi:hypothetical protein
MRRFAVLALLLALCSSVMAQEAYVEGNYLAFSSIDAYDRYASNEADRSYLYYYTYYDSNVTSRAEMQEGSANDEEVYPDFLNLVLNQDNIMRISTFLVKVDLDNGFALAINANQPNAYWSLVYNDWSAPGMLYFDGESDDALEQLENIENGGWMVATSAPRKAALERAKLDKKPHGPRLTTNVAPRMTTNGCSGASRQKCDNYVIWDQIPRTPATVNCAYDLYRMDYKVVYQKFIFYFSLQSKQKSATDCQSTNWITSPGYDAHMRLDGNVRYHKRCGPEVVQHQVYETVDRVQNWRPYEGSRSLSSYDFSATFSIGHPNTSAYATTKSCSIIDGYTPGGGGTATHAGMTWSALENRTGVVHVGSDGTTNAYNGDTPVTTSLPVLCLRQDGSAAPSNISPDFYNGWTGGPVAITGAVAGSTLTSRAAGDALCSSTFGANWRMAEFHDGNGGWSYWGFGNIAVGQRFWVAINDQAANPWN